MASPPRHVLEITGAAGELGTVAEMAVSSGYGTTKRITLWLKHLR
jgi:hypothetical protein